MQYHSLMYGFFMSGAKRLVTAAAVTAAAAAALLIGLWPQAAMAEIGWGQVTLKSGEVIEADVAKQNTVNYILRTPSGLRVIARANVLKVEAGVEIPRTRPRPASPPRATPDQPASAVTSEGAVKSGGTVTSEGEGGAAVRPAAELADTKLKLYRSLQDPRLEAARAGGPPPVLEVGISGTIDGKPIPPADPFTFARLTFFFGEESRPRFEVLAPTEVRGKAAAKAGRAEYRVEVSAEAKMEDILFYGTSVLKTFRSRVSLRMIRLSDKKVVDAIEVADDEGGDEDQKDEICRRVYQRTVERLLRELKKLRTFGGTSIGTDDPESLGASARP